MKKRPPGFRRPWTATEIKRFRYLYLHSKKTAAEIAAVLGRHPRAIYRMQHLLCIKKKFNMSQFTKGVRRSPSTEFQKGHKTWNKSRKGVHYSRATEFKKGHQPANTKYNGCIRIRIDTDKKTGKIREYKWIRIKKAKWIMYHVYVWKKTYGRIPKDHIIVFRDGNTMNCRPSNLECITHIQHAANTRMTDGFIAKCLASNRGGKGSYDKKLYERLLKKPDLLDAKRKQLQLNQLLKESA